MEFLPPTNLLTFTRSSFIFVFVMAVSICTINVNGITEHSKREKVFKYLLDKQFDIYLLQETHLPDITQR